MRIGGWLLVAAVVSCGGRKPLGRGDGAVSDAVADGADVAPDVAPADGRSPDGDASDGDASDGDASDGRIANPVERACIALETAKVAFANRCAPYPIADLAGVLARSRCGVQVLAVEEGRAAFDPQRAAACQAAWNEGDCMAPPPECALLVPLIPEGGPCLLGADVEQPGCVRGTVCRNQGGCTGVCTRRLQPLAYCSGSPFSGECVEGSVCVHITVGTQCLPVGREGDPCSGFFNSGCDGQNGFQCSFDSANVCRRLPVTGPCFFPPQNFGQCDHRVAYCSSVGQCVPLGNVGAPCMNDTSCLPTLTCSAGACARGLKAVGEPCGAAGLCVRGAHCDVATQTCQRPKPAGLSCTDDLECAGICNPATHLCEPWRPDCER